MKGERSIMYKDNKIGETGKIQSEKQTRYKYYWLLSTTILVVTLITSLYLFQPYIKQYPDSYLTIYAVLTAIFLLLLVPAVYVLTFRVIHTKYLLVYLVAMLFLIGFSFDIDALFYIPWALELIFLFVSKKDNEKVSKL